MLRNFPIIILIVLLLNTAFAQKLPTRNLEYKEKIEQLMRAQDMQGTIVVYDASNNIYYSNDFALAEKGNLPASTFKIDQYHHSTGNPGADRRKYHNAVGWKKKTLRLLGKGYDRT
ncbi:hypothetical protein [Sphingobacterium sp. T2]|uniref:hypothetical protein n=1 Tax=Sphingobacterium sp. T2 TaxID=1590596 RepID=UPI0006911B4A|nr:hypothetical protein [Sphingobacterium sp. T2]